MRFKVASFFYLIFLWIIQIKQTFIAYNFGALHMQGKQKHGSEKGQQSARLKKLSSHSGLLKTRSTSIGQLYFCLELYLGFILYSLLFLGAMAICNCVCHDPLMVMCVMYIIDRIPYFEFLYILQDDITHASVCYVHYQSRVLCISFFCFFLW